MASLANKRIRASLCQLADAAVLVDTYLRSGIAVPALDAANLSVAVNLALRTLRQTGEGSTRRL